MQMARSRSRSYGTGPLPVQFLGVLLVTMACLLSGAYAQSGTKTMKIVALGDSLSAGLGLLAQDAFPAKLQAALKAKGIEATDAVILELGANDALRGLEPAMTQKALNAILDKLAGRHVPVLLAGMKAPRNLGSDYTAKFDAVYPALAANHRVLFYPFFLEGVAADPHLNQGDGMHPTAAGVEVIVRNILPQVEELIARARAR